jgi:CHAT domain-containing protein
METRTTGKSRRRPLCKRWAHRLLDKAAARARVMIWPVCLVIILSTAAQAAESLTYLETAGRYADLRNEIEAKLNTGARANSTQLSYLCIAYGKLKQYEKLFDCTNRLEQAANGGQYQFELDQRVMFIAASDARPLPETLRARAFFELAEYRKAVSAGEKVLEILSRIPESGGTSLYPTVRYRISALEILALSAMRLGDTEKAKRLAQQIEDVSRPFIGGRMWGWIKNNALAQVYMALGNYAEALKYIPGNSSGMKVVVSFVNGLGPYAYRGDSSTTVIEMPRIIMRGKALAETGDKAEAKAAFDELLSSPRIKDMGDIYWVALFERGRIAEADRELDRAAAYYRQAVDIVELQRSSINTEASKIGFVGDKQGLYARLVGILVAQGKAAAAFEYVERSKSRALVDMLSAKKSFAIEGMTPENSRQLLRQLDAVDLSAPVADGPAEPGAAGIRSLMVVRRELGVATPEFSSLVTVSSVPLEELKSLLGEDEQLVEYYYQGNDLYAFVLGRSGLQALKLDGTGLTDQVGRFRNAIEQRSASLWQAPARALYERLWKPLEGALTARNIVVVAHGVLHYLPFAALQDAGGRFLIDRHGPHFLPSAGVLKFLRPSLKERRGPVLVLGNPDLGDAKLDLKFAQVEAQAVADMFPDSHLLVRKDASKANFIKTMGSFSRIHFATHGKFNTDAPLDSGLYLAKGSGDDGVLTVGELYSLNMNADLVTLSACETGLGKIGNGDDVVGLTRGFLYAGSRSIVASLWSVDDQATSELMLAFYKNMGSMNKGEALRQAQIKTREQFPGLFYWAAFQLTGRAE